MESRIWTCSRCAVVFEATVALAPDARLMCSDCTTVVHNFRSAVEDARGSLPRVEAARRTGIPLRTLEDWEAGRRKPPLYQRDGILSQLRSAH